ncbi:hypothetical protein ONZ45_g5064 [Pleurotus djamor]|nr:hypothetical protein ONZ45_g5064 [Pleurotus djamor]
MSSFAHISIRNCASANDSPFPLRLSAIKSFPASRYTFTSYGAALKADWSPRPLPQDDSYLEVTLVDFVAEGRIGVTYTAHVNAAKDGNGKDMQNLIGKQVVVKFAKPQFARSLAREAWFYECLEEAQRTAVAGSYGFYTTPLDPTMNKDMLPWKQIKIEYKEALPSEDILHRLATSMGDGSIIPRPNGSRGARLRARWPYWCWRSSGNDTHSMNQKL